MCSWIYIEWLLGLVQREHHLKKCQIVERGLLYSIWRMTMYDSPVSFPFLLYMRVSLSLYFEMSTKNEHLQNWRKETLKWTVLISILAMIICDSSLILIHSLLYLVSNLVNFTQDRRVFWLLLLKKTVFSNIDLVSGCFVYSGIINLNFNCSFKKSLY